MEVVKMTLFLHTCCPLIKFYLYSLNMHLNLNLPSIFLCYLHLQRDSTTNETVVVALGKSITQILTPLCTLGQAVYCLNTFSHIRAVT